MSPRSFVGGLALAFLAPLALAPFAPAQQAEPEAGLVALHQALLDARTDAVVLNVAAHPDDEASRTNTILRRKYRMRVVTAYTTYGDGGQNAIGREIGPELAYLRVRETLRAAAMSDVKVRWLGMEDFGFSRTLEETRAKWGDEKLLAAMRKVVDQVNPDFVITNHTIAQGHGHHRATFWAIDAVLRERAAQKLYVPALLTRAKIEEAQWILDPAELEPARGETYARLAHRAWVQHETQGPWGPHNPLQVGRDWWKVVNDDVRTIGNVDGVPMVMPWLWVRGRLEERHIFRANTEGMAPDTMRAAVREQLAHSRAGENSFDNSFGDGDLRYGQLAMRVSRSWSGRCMPCTASRSKPGSTATTSRPVATARPTSWCTGPIACRTSRSPAATARAHRSPRGSARSCSTACRCRRR